MICNTGSTDVKRKSKRPKSRNPRAKKAEQGAKGQKKTVAAGMSQEIEINDGNGTFAGFETEMEVRPLFTGVTLGT